MAPGIVQENVMNDEITVSEYIYRRISQLGIRHIFGVPGDFILDFCEEIKKTPELQWVGTCNELNGSYAADGYAKASGKIGVFCSTFGVGELSALNGVTGSFAEFAPVLHIVGTSARGQKLDGRNYHHLIPKRHCKEPDHSVYEKMVGNISVVQESLWNLDTVTQQIDNALQKVYIESRPGYIFLPSDIATEYISASPLYHALDLNLKDPDVAMTTEVAEKVLEKLYKSHNPVVMVDYLVRPFRQQGKVNELIEKLGSRVNLVTCSMSKGFIDESHERFAGVYCGTQSPLKETKQLVEKADFVLDIGAFNVQTNTGNFTAKYKHNAYIELNDYMCEIDGIRYDNCSFVHVLDKLTEIIDVTRVPSLAPNWVKPIRQEKVYDLNTELTQDFLACALQKFLRPGDVLVVETCSFLFTVPDLAIPDDLRIVTQSFYNSIGYALPATIGVSLANRELGLDQGRVVLVQGDGSALMTLQELMTYMRQDIKATILLLNNDGYTVERVILGEKSLYNDIPSNVQWTKLFSAFGDTEGKTVNTTVKTKLELLKVLGMDTAKLHMVELMLDRMDAPDRFRQMIGKLPN